MANPIKPEESPLIKEWYLFKYYFWRVCISWIFTLYICDVVARRLAYLFHNPMSHYVRREDESLVKIQRLEDIGHKLLPDWSENEFITVLNEFVQAVAFITAFTFLLIMMFCKKRFSKGVAVVNIFVRVSYCFSTLHFIRSISYLSTSLPGPAIHCVTPQVEEENKPQDIMDIFFPGNTFRNCGDLIYSGHMSSIVTIFCTIIYYSNKIVAEDDQDRKKWCIFCRPLSIIVIIILSIIIVLLQAVMTIGSRQHYTVDAVLGVIIGYWNFIWHLYVLRPEDTIL